MDVYLRGWKKTCIYSTCKTRSDPVPVDQTVYEINVARVRGDTAGPREISSDPLYGFASVTIRVYPLADGCERERNILGIFVNSSLQSTMITAY
jgi:hypothetical protein